MATLLILAAIGVGGVALANIIVKNAVGGESSTERFTRYLNQIEREQRELAERRSRPSLEAEDAGRESSAEIARTDDSSGLRSRLSGALQSLDRPESEDRSSDSVPESKMTTDQSTSPRDGADR